MPERITRRDFLVLVGIGAGASAAGAALPADTRAAIRRATSPGGGRSVRVATGVQLPSSDVSSRVLVVIEMPGGNDGLSMAPPVDLSALIDLRPTACPDEADLLRPGQSVVLHPALRRLQRRSLTIVDGVGTTEPDGSHFEMLRRWWIGDPGGRSDLSTGFLGRLCDALDAGAPVTGLSIGSASSPMLLADRAGTLGIPNPLSFTWAFKDDDVVAPWIRVFRETLAAMTVADPADNAMFAAARAGLATGLTATDLVDVIGESDPYPQSPLGAQLALASQVITADVGVRVLHVPMAGDFDTHSGHRAHHDALMDEFDEALDAFLADLAERGLGDRVLVATTSEFGRRAKENGNGGLDHGNASAGLLAGPVRLGRVGAPIDLAERDAAGNFVATTSMDQYYATLADGWLGIPAAEVLTAQARALEGVW